MKAHFQDAKGYPEDDPKKGDGVHPQGKEISSDDTESTARQCG